MLGKNDVTGDSLISKGLSEQGKANWDLIFGKKEKKEEEKKEEKQDAEKDTLL